MRDLHTERLGLRPLTIADAASFYRLLQDDVALRALANLPTFLTEAAVGRWITRHSGSQWQSFVIVLTATDEVIGWVGIRRRRSMPTLGYWIGRSYWNRGYATEAIRAVLDHARALGFQAVAADVRPDNRASARVLAKLGFTVAGPVMRLTVLLRGGPLMLNRHVLELTSVPLGR